MNSKFRIRWRWEFALFGSILISVGVLLASEIGYSRVRASHDKIVHGMIASYKLSALLGLVADAETSHMFSVRQRRENIRVWFYSRKFFK